MAKPNLQTVKRASWHRRTDKFQVKITRNVRVSSAEEPFWQGGIWGWHDEPKSEPCDESKRVRITEEQAQKSLRRIVD